MTTRVRRLRLAAGGEVALAADLRAGGAPADIRADVARIIADVLARGDDALVEQSRAFGSPGFPAERLRVPRGELEAARRRLPDDLERAIRTAAGQVRAVAEAQRPGDHSVTLDHGERIVVRSLPVDSVGCYVPGGRAAYPSSLLMAAVPAQVAGVARIAVASPPGPDHTVAEVVRATAAVLGIDEVYAAGGAGAIGALAHGTATVSPVAVIAGPGNAWVTEAKRQVHGRVGIDSLAGPSEVLILAHAGADPEIVACDLLAQAEHGPDSLSVLATAAPALGDAVAALLAAGAAGPPGSVTIVDAPDLAASLALAEAFAPEHLQLYLREEDLAASAAAITRAGCVFLGRNGGTAFGDYVAGSNHILPTGGSARYASAVGPATFMRRMSTVTLPQRAVDALAPHLAVLAEAEGFPQHRRSAEIRMTGAPR